MLQLQVIYGKDAGKCVRFQQSVILIGSDPGNDFSLEDVEISRHHGRLTCNHGAGHYAYCDMQSERGTRVRSSNLDVMLYSHQLPQSVAIAGDCMLTLGQSMIRCTILPSAQISENTNIEPVTTLSLHTLPTTNDPELLSFLLEISITLTKKTTHHSVLQRYAQLLLQHIPEIQHLTFWRFDPSHDEFSCLYERSNSENVLPTLISSQECLNALRTRTATLFSDSEKAHTTLVVPVVTSQRELGVIVADSSIGLTPQALEMVTRSGIVSANAIERTFINADMSSVFDGFVRSIIAVMDARDPASAGHSMRVAQYALFTAQAIQASQEPAFQNVTFTRNHLDELRFAALLHDIGKVVLRRDLLLKAGKLHSSDYQHLLEKLDLFAAWFATQSPESLKDEYRSPQQFEHYREMVTRVQQSQAVANRKDRELIEEMAHTFIRPCPSIPLLTAKERESLLIQRGTLNHEERMEIQRHALISWQYLSQIAWPQRWANVPIYVLQHHEKLNGTGYPYGISGDQIFLQSRIITVCDIFDALTGGDRPYKTRYSFGEAAQILQREARDGALDAGIVDLFVSRVIPQITDPEEGNPEGK